MCPNKSDINIQRARQCSKCFGYYHDSCSERAGRNSDGSFIRCCGDNGDDLNDPKLQLLLKKMQAHIDNSTASIMQEVKSELRDISDNLLTQIQNINKRVDTIETRLDDALNRLECLEKDSQNQFHDENIIHELKDRLYREKNFILINVPEGTGVNSDVTFIKNALSDTQIKLDSVTAIRLGKKIANKSRPLKVRLECPADVIHVLKNKKLLFGETIKCFGDNTEQERLRFKALVSQIKEREKNGESNLTIKYIRGVPRIQQKN